MSDYSGESCDDTDADPDYEEDSSGEDSPIGGSDQEAEEDLIIPSTSSKVKKEVSANEGRGSGFEGRSLSPSAVKVLNLSESDSSSEDESPKPKYLTPKESKSSYFSDVNAPSGENTQYDFSQILALQNRLSKAREEHEHVRVNKSSRPNLPDLEDPEASVSELLAKGEKNVPADDSSSASDEEPEVTEEKKIVQITLENPLMKNLTSRSSKRSSYLEKQLRLIQKENQLLLHKVHLLCLLAHGLFINSVVVNNDAIYGYLLSMLPEGYAPPTVLAPSYLKKLLNWFKNKFEVKKEIKKSGEITLEHLETLFEQHKHPYSLKDLVILFVSLLRGLGLKARFVMSLQPVPLKPKPIIKSKKKGNASSDKKTEKDSPHKSASKSSTRSHKKIPKDVELKEPVFEKNKSSMQTQTSSKATQKISPKTPKQISSRKEKDVLVSNKRCTKKEASKPIPQEKKIKVLSPESDKDEPSQKVGNDYWIEVYIERDEQWISIDIFTSKVDCSQEIYARCTHPVAYVIAWNNDSTLKDVTRRYVPTWHVTASKNRVDQEWFDKSIRSLKAPESIFDKEEEHRLDHKESEMKAPIPTKISDLKNHPLYALQRHLLKFEAIYPPDAVPLGYIRGEPVYSRYCVHELFSREKWIRQGKCVKVNEKPYKIVKSRPKSDAFPGTEKPLEIFGEWQVADYIPPPVIDNKVPRNEYGNIEVYKPSMLPIGTVHLQVPGIQRIAKKMDIDCAPAVVGWEHHGGRSHPIIEGVVVCEEFKETLLDAWCAETDTASQRSAHQRKQNTYKRWLKVAKFVIVKDNLKRKYNFSDPKSQDENPPKKEKKNS